MAPVTVAGDQEHGLESVQKVGRTESRSFLRRRNLQEDKSSLLACHSGPRVSNLYCYKSDRQPMIQNAYNVCLGPIRVRVIDPPFILGGGASSTTLPFSHINGKYFSINRSNSSSTIQPWTLTTKFTSSHRLSRSNILSTEFHSRTWLSRAELNENVTRVTKMTNSVNAFETIVGSVPDNHLAKSSVFAHSASVISSFRRAGWLLKLSRGKSGSPAD